ncbi:MAG TPA: phosphotransferase [Fimbriimonadaceae bacterium]|nr:phosphotransferase [Fimbriimonadaceae bacterium]
MIQEWNVKPQADKPAYFTGAYLDYTTDDIEWVARQFQISGAVVVAPFPGRGNINLHTYSVLAGGKEYLLQKVNSEVFTMPYRVMKTMIASINAQRAGMEAGKCDELWDAIELIPTRDGQPFLDLTDEHGWSVWRLMVLIPGSASFKSLADVGDREDQLELAVQVGRGLATYADLTSTIDPVGLAGSLPGYRDTAHYYRMFHSVTAGCRTRDEADRFMPDDDELRTSTGKLFLVHTDEHEFQSRLNDPELAPYVELVRRDEAGAMALWDAVRAGRIRQSVIHGDPKIENFLFCARTLRVKALVDLDTIMPFTWLADYGDMIRSLVNVAGEKERDLSKVTIDRQVFEAVSKGFLATTKSMTDAEAELLVPAVLILTLELGIRFLTDYLRGDVYFRLTPADPPDLNRVRALVQLVLYERFLEFAPEAEAILARLRA